jgi:hypothetical protein
VNPHPLDRRSVRPQPTNTGRVGAPPPQDRSPRSQCRAHRPAQQVRGPDLRIVDMRFRPANIRVAARRSTPLRRAQSSPPDEAHRARPPPASRQDRRRQRRSSSLRCGRSTLTPPHLPSRSPDQAEQRAPHGHLDKAVPHQEVKRRTDVVGCSPTPKHYCAWPARSSSRPTTSGRRQIVATSVRPPWHCSPPRHRRKEWPPGTDDGMI